MSALIREVIEDEQARRGYHSFLAICESGHLSEIKEVLLQPGSSLPSLSLQDDDGWTALHYAASSGNPQAVEFLLQQGALWAMVDNLGYVSTCRKACGYILGYYAEIKCQLIFCIGFFSGPECR
jgi:ankyrin repeat protein